jgi:hypothetical protein
MEEFGSNNSDKFTFTFTLPDRLPSPDDLKTFDNAEGLKARHHILGRKYIQLLLALSLAVDEVDENNLDTIIKKELFGHLLAFACYNVNEIGEIKHGSKRFDNQTLNLFKKWFFWSPYNLFIGPTGDHRIFDPLSGVEQTCPSGFPENRWAALKAIPQYFEQIGVPLKELVNLHNGGSAKWGLIGSKDKIKNDLQLLIKAVCQTGNVNTIEPYAFNEAEWIVVQPSPNVLDKIIKQINIEQSVDTLYQLVVKDYNLKPVQIIWKDFVKLESQVRRSYKFVLRPKQG